MQGIVPTHCKTPGWVHKAGGVRRERTGNRVHDGQLTKGLDCAVQHDTDQHVSDNDGSRTTGGQHLTGRDEQTSTCARGVYVSANSFVGGCFFFFFGRELTD